MVPLAEMTLVLAGVVKSIRNVMEHKYNKIYINFILIFHVIFFLIFFVSLPLVFLFDWYGIVVGMFILLTILQYSFTGGDCVFTILENKLRKKYDMNPYNGGCISHYFDKWFAFKVSERAVNIFLFTYFFIIIVTVTSKILQKIL